MNRRNLLSAVASPVLLSVFQSLSACATLPSQSQRKPNVVFILADDLGYGDIGPYGQKKVATPNLDRLAAEGVKFTQAYAGSTVCAPSRAALLTGRNTGHAAVRGNKEIKGITDAETGQAPLPHGSFTLGHLFKSAGYKTAAVGKWGLGALNSSGAPLRQGFDYFYGYLDQRAAHSYYPQTLWENDREVRLDNPPIPSSERLAGDPANPRAYEKYIGPDYSQERITQKSLEFIETNAGRPFFLYLAFTLPHAALQLPDSEVEEHLSLEEKGPYLGQPYTPQAHPRAARAAMIARLDKDVGRVLKKLEMLGLSKDTVVIFTSDNGPSGEGGSDFKYFDATGGLRGRKRDLYEGGIRVPLIAKWDGQFPVGRIDNSPCAFWDFMPTFSELLRVHAPRHPEGQSILPLLKGKTPTSSDARSFYWEYHGAGVIGHAQAVRFGTWKAIKLYPTDKLSPVRTELYNLSADPRETMDLASSRPDLVRTAEELFNARSTATEPAWNFSGQAEDE